MGAPVSQLDMIKHYTSDKVEGIQFTFGETDFKDIKQKSSLKLVMQTLVPKHLSKVILSFG